MACPVILLKGIKLGYGAMDRSDMRYRSEKEKSEVFS
jgi:hypothetical protein